MTVLAIPSYGSVLIHLMREDLETRQMKELATATGFLVNASDGYHLVTNWHAITGYAPETGESLGVSAAPPTFIDVDFHNPDDLDAPAVHRYPLYEDGQPSWRIHPTLGQAADVIALEVGFGGSWAINPGATVSVQAYEIEYTHELQIEPSTEVSVIGFPYGRRSAGSLGIWVRGTVASEPELDFENQPVFLIDCRSRRGQSGSPVIAYRPAGTPVRSTSGRSQINAGPVWQLLGVYSGRISAESDLGKVWKLSVLHKVVEQGIRDNFEFF